MSDPADPDAAFGALAGVDLLWYGMNFSHESYLQVLKHYSPDYDHINWGAWGRL